MTEKDLKSMEESAKKQMEEWDENIEGNIHKLKSPVVFKADAIADVEGDLHIDEPKMKKKKRSKSVETDLKNARNKDALF
jgi:hypothetical protein